MHTASSVHFLPRQDFLQTLSILSRGTMEEKLTWTFALYDINGDGCVTREEMTNIVTAIYDMVDRPSMSAAIAAAAAENESVPGGTVAAPLMPMRMDGERIKQKVDQLFQVSAGGRDTFYCCCCLVWMDGMFRTRLSTSLEGALEINVETFLSGGG